MQTVEKRMMAAITSPVKVPSISAVETARREIRGSSLLLIGRGLSVIINFLIQVVTVHYLAKNEYGAFAYAVSIVGIGEIIAALGFDRAMARFVPLYYERREYDKLFGAVLFMFGTVAALGLLILALFYTFQGFVGSVLIGDEQAVVLSLILIALAPTQAIDRLVTHLFAIFDNPVSIFFRKYVLEPGLKLLLVLFLVFGGKGVLFLAGGYLIIGLFCLATYAAMLFRVLRDHELFRRFRWDNIRVPTRDILIFAIPLLTTDAMHLLQESVHLLLLQYFHDIREVASFAVILPAARLNELVLASFGLLFVPSAVRLNARNDAAGISHLCWHTSAWMAVVFLPIFLATFSLAQPLTMLLYGDRYQSSAAILAIVSLGYYFNGVLGFSGLTLRALGKVRYIVVIDLLAVTFSLALDLALIPAYGALGAAIGTAGGMVAHTLAMQAAVKFAVGIKLLEPRYLAIYLTAAAGALSLLLLQRLTYLSIWIGLLVAALICLAAVWINQRTLDVGRTFPELLRLPWGKSLFDANPATAHDERLTRVETD